MAPLILRVTKGSDIGKVFTIEKDIIKIGRRQTNDVHISDKAVSGFHATLILKDGEIIIRDHSKNGTFVNGQRIKEATLKDGDEITIGLSKLRIYSGSASEEETVILLEEKTAIKKCNEIKEQKKILSRQKIHKKRLRPIVILIPILFIILGILYLLFPNSAKNREVNPTPLPPKEVEEKKKVNIEEEWRKLCIEDINDGQVRSNLEYAKEQYNGKNRQLGNLYEAITIWKQTLNLLDLNRKKILENIIYTAEKELREDIEKEKRYFRIYLKADKREAARRLERIIKMVPDYNDPDYKWAKKKLSQGWNKYLPGE